MIKRALGTNLEMKMYFPLQQVQHMAESIQKAFVTSVDSIRWMDIDTKTKALEKVSFIFHLLIIQRQRRPPINYVRIHERLKLFQFKEKSTLDIWIYRIFHIYMFSFLRTKKRDCDSGFSNIPHSN